jgi:Reverse transcriptase (RNA-dependent DNA polymerase).
MESTCFQMQNVYYEQTYGTPMGSPISPVIADIVMQDLEEFC